MIGNYSYAYLFTPDLPFLRRRRRPAPFFSLDQHIPVVLAIILGLQHALAMLAGIITPPIIITGQQGANFPPELAQYVVSTSLIVSGILSAVQIRRFHLYKTPYYLGTGILCVVGTSFSFVSVSTSALQQMYDSGVCPTDAHGSHLPCPDGYGALLGSTSLTALLEVLISFTPPRILQKVFPPIVIGPTVVLVGESSGASKRYQHIYLGTKPSLRSSGTDLTLFQGASLVKTGFEQWSGGSGDCSSHPSTGQYRLCPEVGAAHALPWGSAEYIGLGFLVFFSIILCERFGAPIMKSSSIILGLLVGCIVAAACGYFDRSTIDAAPAVSFIWVHTFKLSIYGPAVLPMLTAYLANVMGTIAGKSRDQAMPGQLDVFDVDIFTDITAASDVSQLPITGELFDSRVQGGILADGVNSRFFPLLKFLKRSGRRGEKAKPRLQSLTST